MAMHAKGQWYDLETGSPEPSKGPYKIEAVNAGNTRFRSYSSDGKHIATVTNDPQWNWQRQGPLSEKRKNELPAGEHLSNVACFARAHTIPEIVEHLKMLSAYIIGAAGQIKNREIVEDAHRAYALANLVMDDVPVVSAGGGNDET